LKNRKLWNVAALVVLVACARTELPPEPEPEIEDLLPESASLENWHMAEGPASYSPDTLWEFLDGGAPRYLDYGFVRMVRVRYQLSDDPLSSVSLEVYEMASELGAFGIYSSIRPLDLSVRAWGAEGYRSGNAAAAWKGTVFVHASADDERPELIEAMEAFVSRACALVVAEVSRPSVLDPLPPEHLVPRSERFVASDLFGHAALPGGVLATYEIDGLRGDLFFSELENEAAAEEAVEAFRSEKERWAEVSGTATGLRFEDPVGESGTVRQSGRFVIGVQGDLAFEDQDILLQALVARLGN
jgi:hypothetical protein